MARRESTDPAALLVAAGADLRRRLGLAPGQRGGGVADHLVLATNLVFLTPLPQGLESLMQRSLLNNDPVAAQQLALWLGAIFVLQAAGAYLKRRSLQAHLAKRGPATGLGCPAMGLLLFNYILSLLILITIIALVPALSDAEPVSAIAAMFIAAVPTVLVYRAMTPSRQARPTSWLDSPQVEWVADFFLLTYVVTNTMFFNLVTSYKASPPASFDDVITHLLSLVAVLVIVFLWYLPPRLLFLVEDHQDRGTWIRMAVVMAPIAFHWVVG